MPEALACPNWAQNPEATSRCLPESRPATLSSTRPLDYSAPIGEYEAVALEGNKAAVSQQRLLGVPGKSREQDSASQ
jgi:hypothetical protein